MLDSRSADRQNLIFQKVFVEAIRRSPLLTAILFSLPKAINKVIRFTFKYASSLAVNSKLMH